MDKFDSKRIRGIVAKLSTAGLALALAGCVSGNDNAPAVMQYSQVTQAAWGEAELQQDDMVGGAIPVWGSGMVVLNLEPQDSTVASEDSAGSGSDTFDFLVKTEQQASFELDSSDLQHIASLVIFNDAGDEWVRLNRDQPKASVTLVPGQYRVIVQAAETLTAPVPIFFQLGSGTHVVAKTAAASVLVPANTHMSASLIASEDLIKTGQCRYCDLTGVNLKNANLEGADFTGANLTKANLTNANLKNAWLTSANLTDADARGANLTGTDFRSALLTRLITDQTSYNALATSIQHFKDAYSSKLPQTRGLDGPDTNKAPSNDCSSNGARADCPDNTGHSSAIQMCTIQSWGASDIKALSGMSLFVQKPEIFPGAMLQGQQLGGNNYKLVTIPRSGGRFQVAGLTLAGQAYQDKSGDFDKATVDELVKTTIGPDSNIQSTLADISSSTADAYSEGKTAFDLGLSVGAYGVEVSSLLNSSKSTGKNTVVVKYTQVFYTVDYTPPQANEVYNTYRATRFFRDGDYFKDMDNQIGANNAPLYVSQVKYGRQVLFALTSTKSTDEIKGAFKASFKGGKISAGANVSSEYKNVLNNSEISYIVLGGDAGSAVQPLSSVDGQDMYSKLMNFLSQQETARYSSKNPGAPLAYTLKYVDSDEIATMAMSVVYDKKDCTTLAAQEYAMQLQLRNIRTDINLYIVADGVDYTNDANLTSANRILYQTGGDTDVSLNSKLGTANTTIVAKLGNWWGGKSSIDMVLKGDGKDVYKRRYDFNTCCFNWGWQFRLAFKVDKNTGQVEQVYSDNGRVVPF